MVVLRIVLFIIAIGIAWYLGYNARRKDDDPPKINLPKDYLIGLNFLLNEESDKAVDVFIKMLEVDSDTVETHLSVGKLFRRRGEVDRATKIHQNVIARPQLDRAYKEQAMFELGQDYLSAGVLDQAERIFLELVDLNSHSAQALYALMDIYQQEKAWENAISMAKRYEIVTLTPMQNVIAHYQCELAEDAFQHAHYDDAHAFLKKAFLADSQSVRASLLLAKVYMEQSEYEKALEALSVIKNQNPDYLSESIDLLASCYEKLGRESDLILYLQKLINEYPRVPVVLILAERIRKWKGDKVAIGFVADYLRRYPSLRGIYQFINLYISTEEGKDKQDMHILHKLMKRVISKKPAYQCKSCGFSGQNLHWQCPGCHHWSSVLPMYVPEEEMT